MKKFDEFVNENQITDEHNVYRKLIADAFFDHGLSTNIQFDANMLMVISAYVWHDASNKRYTENIDKTIKMMKFIKEMLGKSIESHEYEDKQKFRSNITFLYDFSNLSDIDPYFKSLKGIEKYNL